MGRPPLPIGTYGRIRSYPLESGGYRARTKFRDYDGVTREVERVGPSKARAEAALKEAIRDRARIAADGEITSETLLVEVARVWLAEIRSAVEQGKKSPNTLSQYQYRFDRHIDTGLGRLRVREVTVGRSDRLIKEVREHFGTAAAKTTRTVLGGVMGLAVRHDAVERNPVREVGWIEGGQSTSARALSLVEAIELRIKIRENERASESDLVDFTDFMLATGLRIGEAAAVTWDALDLEAGTVEVRGTVIRVKGEGLRIKGPKSANGYRTLELPGWAVQMLRNRSRVVSGRNEWGVVFTAPVGGLRDPSNTQADLREIFAATGYGWVTSHVYRKTVATLMDNGGLTARQAADQLGHAKVSMTQDNYFGRKVAKTGAAGVLSALSRPDESV